MVGVRSTICLERIFCDIFLTVSFEKFFSLCWINAARVVSLSLADQNPLIIDGLIWVLSLSGEISGCALDLVEGYMVRNVNVNVDLCFSLSCKLFGRLAILGFTVNLLGDWLFRNIKRWKLSIAKVVGEGGSGSWRCAWTKGEVHNCKLAKAMSFHSDLLQLCLKKNGG